MNIVFSKNTLPESGSLAIGVSVTGTLTETAQHIDDVSKGALTKAIATSKFKGVANNILVLEAPHGLTVNRLLLIGLGNSSDFSPIVFQRLGANVIKALSNFQETSICIALDKIPESHLETSLIGSEVAFGAQLGAYKFVKYFTKGKKAESSKAEQTLTIMTSDPSGAEKEFRLRNEVAKGVELARNLVSEPSNIKYPNTIAKDIEALRDLDIDIKLIRREELSQLSMGALLGVSQGSVNEPVVAVMNWRGAPDGSSQQPVALVGKGVTFDTGGISLKPAGGMEEMKYDMAGAGAVIGAMRALAGRKAKCNVVGVVGLVENMPDGNAQRPGDVVHTMSGQTIEVINTDAEGRLVLADILYYTQVTYNPRIMVNLATLTGAIVVALGTHIAGIFSNNKDLAAQLIDAGEATGENVWQLPLDDRYDKEINSEIADMKNVGKSREAGSIAGAQLLQRFVGETPWAHIDIAGMAWMKRGDDPVVPKGATGFGVRLLDKLVSDNYED